MKNFVSTLTNRISIARGRCEAHGLHHRDCPGTAETGHGVFVLHHVIRRRDRHHPDYQHRDDVEHLRYVWNGSTGLGAGGCHGRIHDDLNIARELGLLAAKPTVEPEHPFRFRRMLSTLTINPHK